MATAYSRIDKVPTSAVTFPEPAHHPSENLYTAPQLLSIETVQRAFPAELAKRWMDIFGALFALIIAFPIIIITAIAIKISSPGPIFFSQSRVGLGGKLFKMYKFRSMIVGSEELKKELEKRNEISGPVFKIKRDPRITRVGSFIRKYSIDELPQLWNVLNGDMSLVGPRPAILKEVIEYSPEYLRRLSVKPGLTCIWQISGRSNIPFTEWMKLDLDYINNWSLWLDIILIVKTFRAVFKGTGAY